MLGTIGRGGRNKVWSVQDRLDPERPLVMKLGDHRPALREEFLLGASLDHPALVRPLDFGYLESGTFFTMEPIFTAENVDPAAVCFDALDALDYLHERGILHLDLKPDNLIFSREGRTRLLDLGTAAAYRNGWVVPGQIGAPRFRAPELDRGEAPSRASDLFAAGATLLALEPPAELQRLLRALCDPRPAARPPAAAVRNAIGALHDRPRYLPRAAFLGRAAPLHAAVDAILHRARQLAIVAPEGGGKSRFLRVLLQSLQASGKRAAILSLPMDDPSLLSDLEVGLVDDADRVAPDVLEGAIRNLTCTVLACRDVSVLPAGSRPIELSPLNAAETEMVVRSVAGAAASLSLAEEVTARALGNPGAITRTIEDLCISGRLARWGWRADSLC